MPVFVGIFYIELKRSQKQIENHLNVNIYGGFQDCKGHSNFNACFFYRKLNLEKKTSFLRRDLKIQLIQSCAAQDK